MLRCKLLCLMPVVALLVGCGGKTVMVVRKPQWNFAAYERLAVVPIQSDLPEAKARTAQMTTMLTDLLVQNGAFTIVSNEDLAAVLKEQDKSLTDLADPSTKMPSGLIQVAQALVIGRVTDFATERRREQIKVPDIRFNSRGVPYVAGTKTVMKYTHEARIGGSVRVVDVGTSEAIFAYSIPVIIAEDSRTEQPPKTSVSELASQAAHELTLELYAQVAPVRRKAKLKDDMLFVATDYYDGEYDEAKRISTGLDQFMIVVQGMPRECDRNSFRVALTVKDGRRDLFSEEFVWSGTFGQRGKAFTVPLDALTAAGAQEFTAKLYVAGDEAPALTRDFELETPKQ